MVSAIKEKVGVLQSSALSLKQKLKNLLQDKYNYSSSKDYLGRIVLVRGEDWNNKHDYRLTSNLKKDEKGQVYYPVTDLSLSFDEDAEFGDIRFTLIEYADYGVDSKEGRFVELKKLSTGLSLTELKLITKLADEIYKERGIS